MELTPFRNVIGVDPSQKMLDGACNYITSSLGPVSESSGKFDFVQSQAEDLKFMEDASVDLIISGMFEEELHNVYVLSDACLSVAQASHWFDWKKLWPELARIVRSNGTVALWVQMLPCP